MTGNKSQADYWSSSSGQKWISFEEELDTVFEVVNEFLIDRAKPLAGERIVDIGCGTGATTRAFAELVGSDGFLSAIDISQPLLDHARSREAEIKTKTEYRLIDAQSGSLDSAPFDAAISRFGVMFFADPVAALANIRTWLKPSGRLVVAAWAAMDGNPWFECPRDGAVAQLGPPDPSDPNGPGPLGFQNIEHVADALGRAGFTNIEAECVTATFRHPGPIEKVAALAANIGPAARIIKKYGGGPADIDAIGAHVMRSFRQFDTPEGLRIPARLNFFTAENSA